MSTEAVQEVLYEKQGRVRIMTLNRPEKMNALTVDGERLQEQFLNEFNNDDDAWVLIVAGTGRAFSTGLDLAYARQMMAMKNRPRTLIGANAQQIWKPIIAAINGYAVGGGCELALACDIRIAADDARIGLPEAKRAFIPGAGGCQRLPRIVPLGEALMMLFTGDWVDAETAYRIGLVQKVVPRDSLLQEAIQLAEKICENGPVAVRTIKEAVYKGLDMPLHAAMNQDQLYSLRNRQTEDSKEGPKAFMEKRKPNYTGK